MERERERMLKFSEIKFDQAHGVHRRCMDELRVCSSFRDSGRHRASFLTLSLSLSVLHTRSFFWWARTMEVLAIVKHRSVTRCLFKKPLNHSWPPERTLPHFKVSPFIGASSAFSRLSIAAAHLYAHFYAQFSAYPTAHFTATLI